VDSHWLAPSVDKIVRKAVIALGIQLNQYVNKAFAVVAQMIANAKTKEELIVAEHLLEAAKFALLTVTAPMGNAFKMFKRIIASLVLILLSVKRLKVIHTVMARNASQGVLIIMFTAMKTQLIANAPIMVSV
jgi:hypothetical protein